MTKIDQTQDNIIEKHKNNCEEESFCDKVSCDNLKVIPQIQINLDS